MMRENVDDRTCAAFHEAGHAVAAYYLRDLALRIVQVFITKEPRESVSAVGPETGWRGWCEVEPFDANCFDLYQRAVQHAAGQAAEKIAGGNPSASDIRQDEEDMLTCAKKRYPGADNEERRQVLLKTARTQADELMQDTWVAVEAVADRLLASPYAEREVDSWPGRKAHFHYS